MFQRVGCGSVHEGNLRLTGHRHEVSARPGVGHRCLRIGPDVLRLYPWPVSESSTPTVPAFEDLGLDPKIEKVLREVGYESPSPIQAEAIPPLLAGQHVVGLAQTGTGKTAAFALPILSRIDLSQTSPQVLVLAPTRELALQVSEAFGRYAAHLKGLHVLPVYGGQGYGVQLSALRRGVHVVVGTPGRVMDHLEKGTLDLSGLRFVVLDEADEMLNMGFAEDVETILAGTPEDKQLALFSATIPPQIRRIIKKYAPGATEITVKSTSGTATNVAQRYLKVAHPQKLDALTRILEVENFDGMIVFVAPSTPPRSSPSGCAPAVSPPRRSTVTSHRCSASARSTSSARASSTSWSPPTSPRAASTSSGSAT